MMKWSTRGCSKSDTGYLKSLEVVSSFSLFETKKAAAKIQEMDETVFLCSSLANYLIYTLENSPLSTERATVWWPCVILYQNLDSVLLFIGFGYVYAPNLLPKVASPLPNSSAVSK